MVGQQVLCLQMTVQQHHAKPTVLWWSTRHACMRCVQSASLAPEWLSAHVERISCNIFDKYSIVNVRQHLTAVADIRACVEYQLRADTTRVCIALYCGQAGGRTFCMPAVIASHAAWHHMLLA